MINSKMQYKSKNNYLLMVLLFLSFVWISLYPVLSALTSNFYFSYGNIFDFSSGIFSNALLYIIITSLISWVGLELIFVVYRFLLAFKIYSFVIPSEKLKNEMRTFFIYRNIFFGIFLNLCFLFPYIHAFVELADVIITMTTFICFACHIKKTYSEPIVGHFVFKCFISPVILYEILVVLIAFLEVI